VPNKHQTQPQEIPVTSDSLRRLQLALEAQIVAAGAGGVLMFNGRTGNVVLSSADVTGALGYTPSGGGYGYMPISVVDLPLADASEPLLRLLLTDGLTFVDGTGSAGVAATSPSALRVRKNGAANGTVTFTGTTGVVAITNLVYAPGDLFELYPPATLDATLDQVSITLRTT
jgi:hypothetical protein